MTFQVMALIMTCGGCLLGLRFIFAGGSVLKEWGIEATAGALILFRRIGAIYPGPFSSPICDGRFGIPAGGNV